MSCANIHCNQGRNCTCRRAAPVDTSQLPPGGFWIAQGVACLKPPPEPLSRLEITLIALAGFGAGVMVGGIAWGLWKGLL